VDQLEDMIRSRVAAKQAAEANLISKSS